MVTILEDGYIRPRSMIGGLPLVVTGSVRLGGDGNVTIDGEGAWRTKLAEYRAERRGVDARRGAVDQLWQSASRDAPCSRPGGQVPGPHTAGPRASPPHARACQLLVH